MTELEKPITDRQFRALHVWCDLLAAMLEDAGVTRQAVYEYIHTKGMEMPWTKEAVKEVAKIVIKAMWDKDSTTQMSTTDPDMLVRIMSKFFGENWGVNVPPWPDNRRGRDET
jgi:hypothetical protein